MYIVKLFFKKYQFLLPSIIYEYTIFLQINAKELYLLTEKFSYFSIQK